MQNSLSQIAFFFSRSPLYIYTRDTTTKLAITFLTISRVQEKKREKDLP